MITGDQKSEIRGRRSEGGGRRLWLGTLAVVILGTVLMFSAGRLNSSLAEFRLPTSDLRSTTSSPTTPPLVSFTTVVLGGFRGIVADLLEMRAAALQDQGRYFELVQLADWITMLEPQFAEIWTLHAWNMAYNVSVMLPDERARWRWVQNGIQLLRDRGRSFCPTDPQIYHEIGMIYLHKIGSSADPAATFYKRQLALQMMEVFGPTGRLDESARPAFAKATAGKPASKGEERAALGIVGLDLERMLEVDRTYGPLDWRVAETHALYWAHAGTKLPGKRPPDARCRRMVYHAMMALFDHGRLTHNQEEEVFVTSPEFDLLPNVLATLEQAITESPELEPEVAYASFLGSAVQTSFFYRRKDEARRLFDMLHSRFPSRATEQGFDAFARSGGPRLPQFLTTEGEGAQ